MAFGKNTSRTQHNDYATSLAKMSRIAKIRRTRQEGAFAVMSVPLLIVMIGFWGLALDIGQIYNRKVDLHGVAKAAALAAARELDGTPAGLVAARNAASAAVANLRYQNYGNGIPFTWRDDALSFSTTSSRTGGWIPSTAANGQAAALFFARVDTADLDPAIGEVRTFLISIFDSSLATVRVSDSAIAGRTSVKTVPIGICAMSPDAAAARPATSASGPNLSELVQYGFRRGISYDLMKLNPNNTKPIRFAINPVSEPGTNSQSFSIAALEPFVCSGSMWVKRITGNTIRVSELPDASPLASLHAALNTRFDTYASTPCTSSGAAPDINIKSYAYDQAGVVKWMTPDKGTPAVATTTDRGKSEPVFELSTPPASPGAYGPLWAYAKAARAPSPVDSPEPVGGYATFSPTDWPTLYPSGPTSSNYPTSPPVPYRASTTGSGYYQAPSLANRPMAIPHRRLLNIPILSCNPTAPSGTNAPATVVAIGKFFMTVPATDNSLIAEFAGLLPPQSMPGHVELFP
ncbi:pilus assembly protein TadG-related protein [Massilia sp. GCM10023247]|uniref:pilus assembly protein TadG-related protein n=1 Tax=Massilia sp. GCM10023247 TaxID=3252643 RepID=UPI003617968C